MLHAEVWEFVTPWDSCVQQIIWILYWDVFSHCWLLKKSKKPCVCTVSFQERQSLDLLLIILWHIMRGFEVSALLFIVDLQGERRCIMHRSFWHLQISSWILPILHCQSLHQWNKPVKWNYKLDLNYHGFFSSCGNERSSFRKEHFLWLFLFCFLLYIGIHSQQSRLCQDLRLRGKKVSKQMCILHFRAQYFIENQTRNSSSLKIREISKISAWIWRKEREDVL